MVRDLSNISRISPPAALANLFADLPLVGNEAREDYEGLFNAIADALKPTDAIAWLHVRDFTDLSWEINRERSLKRNVLESAYRDVVRKLLRPKGFSHPDEKRMISATDKKMKQWDNDPQARQKMEKGLADQGHDAASISTAALSQVHVRIEAIDRRIASYELRRMLALKMIENYSASLARRLRTASSDVIDAEFSEAAE